MSNKVKKYRPSNGTEGESFIAMWCSKCTKDAIQNGSKDPDDAVHEDCCHILGLTFAYMGDDENYPEEWIFDHDGSPCCTAFDAVGGAS